MFKVRAFLIKAVLLIVAIQILNLSVYGMMYHENGRENALGDVNQIDSMAEYITEIILDCHNAFPENGRHDHQAHNQHQLGHEINMIHCRKNVEMTRYSTTSFITIPSKKEYKYLFSREINPPPPKA